MGYWAERQRATNRLVRELASHVLSQRSVGAEQLHGLAKLSWITKSHEGEDAAYIRSTKIPALACIFQEDFDTRATLDHVGKEAARLSGNPRFSKLIKPHTGFTNFYTAYRNSAADWVEANKLPLLKMYRSALVASSDREREALVRSLARLPGIPKAGNPGLEMSPEFYVTPLLFALDPEIEFPIINGNKGVKKLLRKLDVKGASLLEQYRAMVSLYGVGGINDAADIDEYGGELPDFVSTPTQKATKKILRPRAKSELDRPLPPKDQEDYEACREAQTTAHRRIHNQLTNKLLAALPAFRLTEGDHDCKFDAMVHGYTNGRNLLIEAKSSGEIPHLRMAVGQLYDYCFRLMTDKSEPDLAVLVPERPSQTALAFLKWLRVGVLWFEGDALRTSTPSLSSIAQRA